MNEAEDRTARLPDGRLLGYAEYGDPRGTPVLYCAGLHQSRYSARLMESPCRDLGIRLLAADRPGMGLAAACPDRALADWPDDVAAFADGLGIESFAILGFCAGAPYALACAARIPARVSRVSIVGGMAPLSAPDAKEGMNRPNRLFWFIARGMPGMLGLFLRRTADSLASDPEGALDQMSAWFSSCDRVTLSDPGHRSVIIASLQETFRNGIDGDLLDAQLLAQPWGINLEAIGTAVTVWHGAEDATFPLPMGKFLAETLPNARLHLLPAEGHVSLLSHHRRKILEQAAA